ncbi:MAG: SulP family inorganic anion transporter [Bacteroidota bacterium]
MISVKDLRYDAPAGLVVFLVALPLCLGISLASGAPLMAGLISGIIGGLVVSLLSGSSLAVSGPAAGLTIIVLNGIEQLGSYEAFVLAVLISGIIQLILGFLNAGIVAYYFPVSVIKGMLAAIGLILILKQIPHFLGVDRDTFGDVEFFQADGYNTFSEIAFAISHVDPGPVIIGIISLAILILWQFPFIQKQNWSSVVPGALVAVIVAISLNLFFQDYATSLIVGGEHLVSIPNFGNRGDIVNNLIYPDFSQIATLDVFIVGLTISIVASLETLLSIEATDKLDPQKRITPTSRELRAQGVGNIICGLIGGLPMTAVIVRSSANIDSGAKTKFSAFIHGLFLLLSVIFLTDLLNLIPLSSLAAILLMVGFKLTKPSLYRAQLRLGGEQFVPFLVTIVAILFTDLLIGIIIGMAVGIFYILKVNYENPYSYRSEENNDQKTIKIYLSEQVTFINKASLAKRLNDIPDNSIVEINGENSQYISHDVLDVIHDFKNSAPEKAISLTLKKIPNMV